MCISIPSKVVEVGDMVATVECHGVRRQLSLLLLGEEVEVGDYLLAQAGGFASEKVDEERALEAIALFDQTMESTYIFGNSDREGP